MLLSGFKVFVVLLHPVNGNSSVKLLSIPKDVCAWQEWCCCINQANNDQSKEEGIFCLSGTKLNECSKFTQFLRKLFAELLSNI